MRRIIRYTNGNPRYAKDMRIPTHRLKTMLDLVLDSEKDFQYEEYCRELQALAPQHTYIFIGGRNEEQ